MTFVDVADKGRVRRLVLNRPDKLNALSPGLLDELAGAIADANEDDDVHVIVLSGAGRAFSAGADVSVEDASFAARLKDAPWDMARTAQRVRWWSDLKAMPKPLIAQVHGYCVGLANELIGCTDLVVCADTARFGMPEIRQIGLFPTLGFWPERIGVQRTLELALTGRFVDGEEAVRLGLALACVPADDLHGAVDQLATQIAEVDLGRLVVTKAAVNSWSEASGAHDAARRGAQFHAIYHQAGGHSHAPDPATPPTKG